jgi:hypothetical protein
VFRRKRIMRTPDVLQGHELKPDGDCQDWCQRCNDFFIRKELLYKARIEARCSFVDESVRKALGRLYTQPEDPAFRAHALSMAHGALSQLMSEGTIRQGSVREETLTDSQKMAVRVSQHMLRAADAYGRCTPQDDAVQLILKACGAERLRSWVFGSHLVEGVVDSAEYLHEVCDPDERVSIVSEVQLPFPIQHINISIVLDGPEPPHVEEVEPDEAQPKGARCISDNTGCGYYGSAFRCAECRRIHCWCDGGSETESEGYGNDLCSACFMARKESVEKPWSEFLIPNEIVEEKPYEAPHTKVFYNHELDKTHFDQFAFRREYHGWALAQCQPPVAYEYLVWLWYYLTTETHDNLISPTGMPRDGEERARMGRFAMRCRRVVQQMIGGWAEGPMRQYKDSARGFAEGLCLDDLAHINGLHPRFDEIRKIADELLDPPRRKSWTV